MVKNLQFFLKNIIFHIHFLPIYLKSVAVWAIYGSKTGRKRFYIKNWSSKVILWPKILQFDWKNKLFWNLPPFLGSREKQKWKMGQDQRKKILKMTKF